MSLIRPNSNKKEHAIDMTVGQPFGLMVRFALPLFLGNLFQQLYNTVDTMVVGNFLDSTALAAVGAGFPLFLFLMSFFTGLGIAVTVVVSQRYGARDFEGVNQVANTVYRIGVVTIIPFMILGLLATKPALLLMNVPDDGTLTQAVEYMVWVFAGLFATLGYNLNAGLMQGMGDSVTSLKLLILSTFINIGLDILLVGSVGLGVAGAAIATAVAQAISWILGLIYLNKAYDFMSIRLLRTTYDPDVSRTIFRLGIPSAIQNGLFSLGLMAMGALVNSYGQAFIAGFNVANKIDTIIFFPIMSLGNAITTYTGQNVGAKRMDRVQQGIRTGVLFNVGIAVVLGVLFMPLFPSILKLFTREEAVIQAGLTYLNTVIPFYIFIALLFAFNGVLRGLNQMHIPLISTIVSLILARVPSAYWLGAHFGRDTIFYSYGLGWALGALISGFVLFSGRWKNSLDFFPDSPQEGKE